LALLILDLAKQKAKIQTYISHRMNQLAPKLCQLVGDLTAAKLLMRAHSLKKMAQLPASTL
jgi:nucleolar protein 56